MSEKKQTDFLGGPVLKTPRLTVGHRLDPQLGKFHMLQDVVKRQEGEEVKKKKNEHE